MFMTSEATLKICNELHLRPIDIKQTVDIEAVK